MTTYMIGCWQARIALNGAEDHGLRRDWVVARCKEEAREIWDNSIMAEYGQLVRPLYIVSELEMREFCEDPLMAEGGELK